MAQAHLVRSIAVRNLGEDGLWFDAYGLAGAAAGDGNASMLTQGGGGGLVGATRALPDGWYIGALGGYGLSAFDLGTLGSTAQAGTTTAGLYGGRQIGGLRLHAGLLYGQYDIRTNRNVAFSGFSDVVTARYSAGLGQAFARLDYDIETDGATYTPFAELAFAEAWRGSFAETGGDAALIGTPATLGQAVTTLGLRSHSAIDVGTQTGLFTAGLAWRHGYGPDNPQATLGFSESDLFVIEGAPLSRDALILEAGLALDIGGQGKLDLTYNGAWAMGPSVSHMITARLRGLF